MIAFSLWYVLTLIVLGTFLLLVYVFFGGVFLSVLHDTAEELHTAHRLSLSNPVTIRSFLQNPGANTFEGTVETLENQDPIETPFSGEKAVLSTYKIKVLQRSDQNQRTHNDTGSEGTMRQEFVVRDETGAVLVDPADAEIIPANMGERVTAGKPENTTTESRLLPEEIGLRISTMTDEFDIDNVLPSGSKKSYADGYIAPGDHVYVYGAAVTDETPQDSVADARVEQSETAPFYKIYTEGYTPVLNSLVAASGVVIAALMFGGLALFALLWLIILLLG